MPAVPEPGVPDNAPAPGVNVTPDGSVPVCDSVGAGLPVAVTVKLPALKTVNVVELALVIFGATNAAVGVTNTVPDAAPAPAALVAVTEQVYCVPLASPDTNIGEVALLPIKPLGLQVALYCVIGLPPVFTGSVNERLAWATPPTAAPMVGAPGSDASMVTACVTCRAAL